MSPSFIFFFFFFNKIIYVFRSPKKVFISILNYYTTKKYLWNHVIIKIYFKILLFIIYFNFTFPFFLWKSYAWMKKKKIKGFQNSDYYFIYRCINIYFLIISSVRFTILSFAYNSMWLALLLIIILWKNVIFRNKSFAFHF